MKLVLDIRCKAMTDKSKPERLVIIGKCRKPDGAISGFSEDNKDKKYLRLQGVCTSDKAVFMAMAVEMFDEIEQANAALSDETKTDSDKVDTAYLILCNIRRRVIDAALQAEKEAEHYARTHKQA